MVENLNNKAPEQDKMFLTYKLVGRGHKFAIHNRLWNMSTSGEPSATLAI